MSKLHVLAVHGIGHIRHDYADSLLRNIRKELKRLGVPETECTTYSVKYDDLLNRRVQNLVWNLLPEGEKAGPLRPLLRFAGIPAPRKRFMELAGHILAYLSPDVGPQVRRRLKEEIAECTRHHGGREQVFYNLVGHSLGSVVAYDYLRLRSTRRARSRRICNFFTCGSPLALFFMRKQATPYPFHPAGVWLNFFDDKDILAYRLQPDFAMLGCQAFVEDVAVQNSRLPFGAHDYWRNAKMARVIARQLYDCYVS